MGQHQQHHHDYCSAIPTTSSATSTATTTLVKGVTVGGFLAHSAQEIGGCYQCLGAMTRTACCEEETVREAGVTAGDTK